MKIFFSSLAVLLGLVTSLQANSLRLYNDSPFKLSVTILGADGTLLGQMFIFPTKYGAWSDSYDGAQTFSITPYTVIWQCDDGTEYGIWTEVSPGATVTAQGSIGARICKPQKKPPTTKEPANRGSALYPPTGGFSS